MKKTFVILANARWDSGGIGGNSSQQYARTLSRLGYRVAYVEPDGTWRHFSLGEITDFEETVVMCDYPYLKHYADLFFDLKDKGCAGICRIVDYWREWAGTDIVRSVQFCPELEEKIVKEADSVFVLNPLNRERLKSIRDDIFLLRNGVDLAHFAGPSSLPSALIPKGRITLGVVSSFWIPRWIDFRPLITYAETHPEDMINIIGDATRVVDEATLPPNIICHGPKPWMEIPQYMHQFDVGVVPYHPAMTQYTNPTKVLEYLACGKPVVSCSNISLQKYPYVYFYEDPDRFDEAVDRAVSYTLDESALMAFLRQQTWEKRVATIFEHLEETKKTNCLTAKGCK